MSKVQVAALRAIVACGEQGQLHAADVCRLAAQGDDRTALKDSKHDLPPWTLTVHR